MNGSSQVRVSEMWLSSCLDDVAEVAKSQETSFVMGWPTTNVIASFRYVLLHRTTLSSISLLYVLSNVLYELI